jgi:DNA-binding Lrp family transcriptional regulator
MSYGAAMDDLDHRILEALRRDGRAPYTDIAATVGLSVSATKRRVDRLIDDEVIKGFVAVVDPAVVGWTMQAMVQLFTNGTVPFARMRSDLASLPEIIEAYTISGAADAVLRVVAKDLVHLEQVISRLRGLSYVQQTDTTMLLSSLVRDPAVVR